MPDPVPQQQQTAAALPSQGPPSGGGIGSQAGAGVQAPAPSLPVAPPSLASLAGVGSPQPQVVPGDPVQPAAVPAPVVPPPAAPVRTLEQAEAELAELRRTQMAPEEMRRVLDFAEIGRQAWLRQLEQQRQVQSVPAAAPTVPQVQPGAPDPLTGVVPFSEQDFAMVIADPNAEGGYRALPGAPADILVRLQQHMASSRRFIQQFVQDPRKILLPLVQEEAKRIALAEAQNLQAQTAHEARARQINNENRNWVYELNAQGQQQFDVVTGKPKLTEAGTMYLAVVEQLWAGGNGIKDPVQLDQVAKHTVIGMLTARRQQQGQPVVPVAVQGTPAAPVVPPVAVPLTPAQQHAANQQALLAAAAQQSANAPLSSVPPQVPVMGFPPRQASLLEITRQMSGGRIS